MLPRFTEEELELLGSADFQRQAAEISNDLPDVVRATAEHAEPRLAPNELAEANAKLIHALEAFAGKAPHTAAGSSAKELALKIRAALDAADRP